MNEQQYNVKQQEKAMQSPSYQNQRKAALNSDRHVFFTSKGARCYFVFCFSHIRYQANAKSWESLSMAMFSILIHIFILCISALKLFNFFTLQFQFQSQLHTYIGTHTHSLSSLSFRFSLYIFFFIPKEFLVYVYVFHCIRLLLEFFGKYLLSSSTSFTRSHMSISLLFVYDYHRIHCAFHTVVWLYLTRVCLFVWQNRYVLSLINCIKSRMQNRFINFSHKISKVLPGCFLPWIHFAETNWKCFWRFSQQKKIFVGNFVDSKSIFIDCTAEIKRKIFEMLFDVLPLRFINILSGAKLWTSAYLEFIEIWAYLIVDSSYTK